jgi:hypothetical protein
MNIWLRFVDLFIKYDFESRRVLLRKYAITNRKKTNIEYMGLLIEIITSIKIAIINDK